jgi:hypothetical protein
MAVISTPGVNRVFQRVKGVRKISVVSSRVSVAGLPPINTTLSLKKFVSRVSAFVYVIESRAKGSEDP